MDSDFFSFRRKVQTSREPSHAERHDHGADDPCRVMRNGGSYHQYRGFHLDHIRRNARVRRLDHLVQSERRMGGDT